jgi:hypothetical protein
VRHAHARQPANRRILTGEIMRSDMQKIIVERPRHGSWQKNHKSGARVQAAHAQMAMQWGEDFDSGPSRASSARRDKWLNENLAPLKRYLRSQLGRPWDKVFSEIRKNLDTRSALGLHVMQHLGEFVAVQTTMTGNVVYARRWCYGPIEPVEGLYVHPVTGLLRFQKLPPRNRRRESPSEPNFVRIDEDTAYTRIGGIWFLSEYGSPDPKKVALGHPSRSVVSKRQCDTKTIRKIESGEFGPVLCRGDPCMRY